jgi:hypothetical protein
MHRHRRAVRATLLVVVAVVAEIRAVAAAAYGVSEFSWADTRTEFWLDATNTACCANVSNFCSGAIYNATSQGGEQFCCPNNLVKTSITFPTADTCDCGARTTCLPQCMNKR